MRLSLRTERKLLTRSGGSRYLDVWLRPQGAPAPFDMTVALVGAADLPQWARSLPRVTDPDPRQAWLAACLELARDEPPTRPQHCIVFSDTAVDTDTLAREAADVWERAWIATSVVSPHRRLRRWARRGGGRYFAEPPPEMPGLAAAAERVVVEVQGVDFQVLTPHREVRGRDVVVGDLPPRGVHVLLTLRFPPRAQLREVRVRVRWRARGVEHQTPWETMTWELADRPEVPDGRVMRRVGRELARLAGHVPPRSPRPAYARPLRPGDAGDGAGTLVGRFVPVTAAWPFQLSGKPDAAVLQEAFGGCLVWAGVASALGKALEGQHPATIRARYGPQGVRHLEPWMPGLPETAGMVSGDVQILREVGESLLSQGGFDPEDFAARLVRLLPVNRGIGNAAVEAAHALMQGEPWYQSGLAANSAGNGAAMRVAPLGLAWSLDAELIHLYRDAVLSALPTHTHPLGVAATVVMAAAIGQCVRLRVAGRPLEPAPFLRFLSDLIRPIERDPVQERRPGGSQVWFSQRLLDVGALLDRSPEDAFNVLWNGSFALESVPAALYCFLRRPQDPREVVLVAVNGGFDADTVGSMAAQLAGVWNGASSLSRLEPTWWAGLEWRDELVELADRLTQVALSRI